MKKNWVTVPIVVGAVFLVVGSFVNPMGSLLEVLLSAVGLAVLGVTFLIIGISDKKKQDGKGKSSKTSSVAVILFSCVLLLFGGMDLVTAGIDLVQGTTEIELTDCSVSKRTSRRLFRHSYSLTGTDEQGDRKTFSIDYDTYNEYRGERDFSIQITGWEHSEVIKDID